MQSNLPELGNLLWQFELDGVPLLPRLVAWGKVGELEGEFWLKVWGERLLFCAASAPERVFAVITPCLQTQDIVSFWRAAIEAQQFGRLVMHRQSLTGAEEMDSAFLIIHQGDGWRWMREWCGGQWTKLRSTRPSPVPVWRSEWKAPRFSTVPDKTLKELRARPFPEEERTEQAFIWLRGSRLELKRVIEACITLSSLHQMDIDEKRSGEGRNRFYYFAHAPFFTSWMYGALGFHSWHASDPWAALLRHHFVGVGWHWARRKNKDERLREGWKLTLSIQTTALQVSPSQHERLEAKLILRDWLRDRVGLSEERITELLA